ncbi:MAG: thioredoxin [Armatimonadetes bacterium]|nr:thioredoxin [Armatimonadota bacterium]
MGSNLTLDKANFDQEVLNSDVPVLVDFWATWCRPCIAIGPHIEEIAAEMQGKAKVFKVNVDEEGDIGMKYGIMSIPALLVFKGGKEVDRMIGAGPKDQIKAFLERHL